MHEALEDSLLSLYVSCPQELVQFRRDVTQLTQLTTEVEQLRKEKADLLGKVEALKLTVRPSHVTVTIIIGGTVT